MKLLIALLIPFAASAGIKETLLDANPVVICTQEQYEDARTWQDLCGTTSNSISNSYCTLVAVNRYCEPATRVDAAARGSLAPSFRSGGTMKNTYLEARKDSNCGADEIVEAYSQCKVAGGEDCLAEAKKVQQLICE
jgi:hypothetical protein